MKYSIAIDGPSSTGKSTIAKMIAKELSITYIDTGSMYRAVAYYLVDNNINYQDEKLVFKELKNIKITLFYEDNNQKISLNNKDITNLIRTKEISEVSSIVSAYEKVREYLVKMQQKLAESSSVIMDGRDIGSVVLPNALLKIYLDCEINERAKRRRKEYLDKNIDFTLEEVKDELLKRDERDINRKNAPLIKVKDAITIDTTNMSILEVTEKIIELLKERVKL